MRNIIIALVSLSFVGCSNYCVRYYKDMTDGMKLTNYNNIEVAQGVPKIIHADSHDDVVNNLKRDGYLLLGYSSFVTHGGFSEKYATEHAQHVKASVVVFQKNYRNTVSQAMPLILPTTEKSYTSFSGYAAGANIIGDAETITYGNSTVYIPTTNDYYNYLISFWVKQKKFRLGIKPRELTEEEKRIIESNKGVVVDTVVNGTTAYNNDILSGDIIKRIDGEEVTSIIELNEKLIKNENRVIEIELIRHGKVITKKVMINKI